jgi:rod shape-determining protein MreD
MPTHFGLLCLVYVAASAQAVLGPRIAIGGAAPEFLLLVAVVAALAVRDWPAIVWAALIGLVGDCLSDRPPGIEMLATTVVVLFVQRMLYVKSDVSMFRGAVLATTAVAVIVLARDAIAAAVSGDPIAPAMLLTGSAAAALYSTGCGLLIYSVWQAIRALLRSLAASAT